MRLNLVVNGEPREVDGLWEGESLLYVLRERLSLPGSKNACEQGECGSCSVYLDGALVCSCLVAAGQAEGREIVTVEGLAPEEEPRLPPIVPRLRIWGEPTVREALASPGSRSPSSAIARV